MEYRNYYLGDATIPEEIREEFTQRVLTIMDQGGLMGMENAEMFGKQIPLLLPPRLDENSTVPVCYSYFEDEIYHAAEYDANTAEFKCSYFGGREFFDAAMAIWVLREFYTTGFGLSHWDGILVNASSIVGWLNYLFEENYTNGRVGDIWAIYKLLPDELRRRNDLTRVLDVCSSELGALKYMVCVMESERIIDDRRINLKNRLRQAYPVGNVEHCLREIQAGEGDTNTKLDTIKTILCAPGPERYTIGEGEAYLQFAEASVQLPAEVSIKLVSKAFGEDYTALMEEIGEATAAAAHPVEKCPHRFGPVRPITTKDYFCCDDDDRVYWCREGGDVKLSDRMEDWLKEVSGEFWRICRELETESMDAGKSVRLLFENLHRVNAVFGKMVCFRSFFYEYLDNAAEPRHQASAILLGRLTDRLSAELPKVNRIDWGPVLAELHSLPRKKLKRYLALLANRDLRKKILGF